MKKIVFSILVSLALTSCIEDLFTPADDNVPCGPHPTSLEELKQIKTVNYYLSCRIDGEWTYSYFCDDFSIIKHSMNGLPYHPDVAYQGFFPGMDAPIPLVLGETLQPAAIYFTISGDSSYLSVGSCRIPINDIPSYTEFPKTYKQGCENISLAIQQENGEHILYEDYDTKIWMDSVGKLQENGAPILYGRFESAMINHHNKFDTVYVTDGQFKLTYR